jgi:hypothetical protein
MTVKKTRRRESKCRCSRAALTIKDFAWERSSGIRSYQMPERPNLLVQLDEPRRITYHCNYREQLDESISLLQSYGGHRVWQPGSVGD